MKPSASTQKLADLRTKHDIPPNELFKYKLLIENIEDYAIFMMDPAGFIQTWNKGAQKAKGYAAEEIIGKHFSIFYLEHDIKAKKPERELEIAKRFGRVEDEDWRLRKDGSRFWANVVITALRDDDGKLVGFGKVTRNLTERKRHEDELRKANLVLRKQQRELEDLNLSKDEFVSLASHQLRTPATGIKQLLGLLLEGYTSPLSPEHFDFIKKAYDSNERQLAIVNSLLKVAQLDAGKLVLHKTPVGLAKLLQAILEDHANTFAGRRQTCAFRDDPRIKDNVMIDKEDVRMAIENIIGNASKYTPEGGNINVWILREGGFAKVSITDSGVGIAPENISRIFDPFSRIPTSLPNTASGSGLSLYWADKVIALHGGRIAVRSTVGEGTTFDVYVPMRDARCVRYCW